MTNKENLLLRNRISTCIILFVLSISLLTSCVRNRENSIVVAGSTSIQPYAEILAEEYAHLYPELHIDVQGGGSTAGITAAISGTADIGMSSRSLKEGEQGLWFVEVALDGLAIIVNPKNPIEDLTFSQVRSIYSAGVTKWSELGGIDSKIHVIAREEGSGTRSAFEELVMGDFSITPKAIVQDSNGAVMQLVADDPNAIGFISLGLVDHSVKALRLGGVMATSENVVNGSYSLFRPFLFVANNEPEGLASMFIEFTMSDDGRQIMEKEGLISVAGGDTKYE